MSRLKYSMSEAFLKKLLRLEGGGKKNGLKGMRGGLEGPQCPVSAPGTCETARGSGRGGPAACRLADLW